MSLKHLSLSLMGLIACGSNDSTPDSGQSIDAGSADTSVAPDAPETGTDSGTSFTRPVPIPIAMSGMGPDQLQSAAAGPNGTFYAAGYAAATAAGTRFVTVVKLTANGSLDMTFGTKGIATTNVAFAGGGGEIGIAVQPSGKLIVSATVANGVDANDRDVAVLRLDAMGALDQTFGVDGVRILDLNTAIDAMQSAQRDSARGVAIGPNGVIYVNAVQRGLSQRTDSDFAVVRLTVDGTVDTAFNTTGKFTLDFGNPSANGTPRGIHVLSSGSVVVAGYASSSLTGNTTQVVLFKLTPMGALDTAFADNGLFHSIVLTLQTEAYNLAVQGNSLVTGGYGRNTGTTNDWVSLRFDATSGARDTTWGGKPNGAVLFDPSAMMLGSNCRNAIALPEGKTLLLGSTGPSNMPGQDAVFAVLDAKGVLDSAYGIHVIPFGTGMGGNDAFWGGAVSGTNVLAVGVKGSGATQTDQANDDAYAIVFPLQ